jgi:uncharacterized protein (TIRG00374 family)
MPTPPETQAGLDRPAPSSPLSKYTIAKALVAAGLFAWLIKSGRLEFSSLFSTPLSPFHGLGMLVLFVAMVLQAWRWWWLLAVQRIGLSFPRTLGLVWIGRFLALALPGVVGGDLVLGYYVTREAPSSKTAGLSTVVLDRAIGFYSSFLLGLAAVVWMICSGEGMTGPVLQMGAAIIFCVLGATLAFSALWADSLRGRVLGVVPERLRAPLESVLTAYRARGRSLLFCLALSLIVGVISMGAYRIAGHAIGTPLGWKQVFLVCPLVFVATALPITPGGIGVGETAASVLFSQFGVETGATIMLVVRLWFFALRLPGALFYVFQRRRPASPAS